VVQGWFALSEFQSMIDIILGLSIGIFFALALAYVKFCAHLKKVS
jgi:hypothetical protein